MPRVNLLGGTYLARSLTADAQVCQNLYPEKNPQDAAAPFTHQLTPGLVLKKIPTHPGVARGMYTATNGNLYYVAGVTLYYIDSNFNITTLGTLSANLTTPVAMQDNGNVLVIADGTSAGYAVNLQPNIAGQPQAFQVLTGGSGGTSGTYTNIPLIGGSGSGGLATVEIAAGGISTLSLQAAGSGYIVGDTVSLAGIPGLSGTSITITGVGAGVNAFAAINDPNWLGSIGAGYVDTFLGFDQPATRNFYTSLSNVTYEELTGTPGQPALGDIIAGGSGGVDNTYLNVPLIGGSGTGGTANITVSGGIVTTVRLLPTGLGYQAGDTVAALTAGIPTNFNYEIVEVNAPAFNPTYIAGKTGYPDLLATIVAVHREWWLMGAYESTEVWYDAGGAAFPFQIMPGVFIQHGCYAPYSVATHDLVVFWLGIDEAGLGTIFLGAGYAAQRISTYAIEKLLWTLLEAGTTLTDAIGMVYKQQDHIFYVLTFPSGNLTLVYDLVEGLWHTRTWTDPNSGQQNRIRANCMALAYGLNVCGDWENGNIYVMDLNTYTDNGTAIVRRRGFPHLLPRDGYGKRVSYKQFIADMDCGNGNPNDITQQQLVTLEYSDDRGRTFTPAPPQSMGAQGEYLVQMSWWRLGMARDRVFRLTWSGAAFTAISGAWVEFEPSET